MLEGKSRVQQHQVSGAIEEELKQVHGFNIKTKVPKEQQQEK